MMDQHEEEDDGSNLPLTSLKRSDSNSEENRRKFVTIKRSIRKGPD